MSNEHLKEAREMLSPNNLQAGMPGRESHFNEIYNFIFDRLQVRQTTETKRAKIEAGQVANIRGRHMNKTMFVCGVPGTGKTATILRAVNRIGKLLEQKPSKIHEFESIFINGQSLSAPEKVYSEILYQLIDEQHQPQKAIELLDQILVGDEDVSQEIDQSAKRTRQSRSMKKKKTKVADPKTFKLVVIDELDLLYNDKKQSIFYNLFDWPTTANSKMILIAIANAMDLPERFMRGRIQSRLGWEKLVFESYNSDCLEAIIESRLGQELLNKSFDKKAIIVATKRIGRTNGDARRILDTCRLAIDKAIEEGLPKVTTAIMDKVGFRNLDDQMKNYVTSCLPLELLTMKSILIEMGRVGEENIEAFDVYQQLLNKLKQIELFKDRFVGHDQFHCILNSLAGYGLIYLEADKPLLKKKLFIKDPRESFKDLIKTEKVKIPES